MSVFHHILISTFLVFMESKLIPVTKIDYRADNLPCQSKGSKESRRSFQNHKLWFTNSFTRQFGLRTINPKVKIFWGSHPKLKEDDPKNMARFAKKIVYCGSKISCFPGLRSFALTKIRHDSHADFSLLDQKSLQSLLFWWKIPCHLVRPKTQRFPSSFHS